MGLKGTLKTATLLFAVATVAYAVRTKKTHGTFLKVPYDFRIPTVKKVRDRVWNPKDPRMMTPSAFGIGWTPNAYQLVKRFQSRRTRSNSQDGPTQPNA